MCRYSLYCPYKNHFACFACRKAFKQLSIREYFAVQGRGSNQYAELARIWSEKSGDDRRQQWQRVGTRLAKLEAEYREVAHKCPECKCPMIDMGLDFKAPRQSDVKAWRVLHGMYVTGHAFHTCGCSGPGWIPNSQSEYRSYLIARKDYYLKQQGYVEEDAKLTPDQKFTAADYWASCVGAVDVELSMLN